MKVALVYDRVNKWGGAERVLLALHKLFPNAPLFTSVHNPETASWANVFDIKTSFLQKLSFTRSNHEKLALAMPHAFEGFSFDGYDLVISVTSEAAKGIITKPTTKHLCYCLTPTRYLWSGYDTYFNNNALRILSKPAVSYLRSWDKQAAQRPDTFVAISKEVQDRIKNYYGRESFVIYPPATLETEVKEVKNSKKKKSGDYFLIVSRLSKFTQYKRVDLAIAACNALQLPLVIVGEGSWKKELEQMAGPTIKFVGQISDDQLATYYKNCKALIFPGIEDFGLTVVEAQRFGKPVIAYRAGGALETIQEGETGIFFDEQTIDSLIASLHHFEARTFDPKHSIKNAERFSFNTFRSSFLNLVKRIF